MIGWLSSGADNATVAPPFTVNASTPEIFPPRTAYVLLFASNVTVPADTPPSATTTVPSRASVPSKRTLSNAVNAAAAPFFSQFSTSASQRVEAAPLHTSVDAAGVDDDWTESTRSPLDTASAPVAPVGRTSLNFTRSSEERFMPETSVAVVPAAGAVPSIFTTTFSTEAKASAGRTRRPTWAGVAPNDSVAVPANVAAVSVAVCPAATLTPAPSATSTAAPNVGEAANASAPSVTRSVPPSLG